MSAIRRPIHALSRSTPSRVPTRLLRPSTFPPRSPPVPPTRIVAFGVYNILLSPTRSHGEHLGRELSAWFSLPCASREFDLLEKIYRTMRGRAMARAPGFGCVGRAAGEQERVAREWGKQLYRDVLRTYFERVPNERKFDEEAMEYFCERMYEQEAEKTAWREIAGARDLVSDLYSSGLTLAVMSNFDSRMRRILSDAGLLRFFDCVLLSSELGLARSSESMFAVLLRTLKGFRSIPQEVVHVGWSWRDYDEARRCGIRAYVLRPAGTFRRVDAGAHQGRKSGDVIFEWDELRRIVLPQREED